MKYSDVIKFPLNRGLKDKKKQQLYNDLQLLLSSGIDIKTALNLVIDNFETKSDIKILKSIQYKVERGSTLSNAIEGKEGFGIFETSSLMIGEETGRISVVLEHLSNFFRRKAEQKRKILSAFAYPIVIIITAIISVMFMLNFVVPMFEEVLHRFGRELPAITKMVIGLSHNIKKVFTFLVLIAGLFVIVIIKYRNTITYKKFVSELLLRIPVFGPLIRKYHLAQFCLFMELLISSKIPLLKALQLLKKMITFYPLVVAIEEFEVGIVKGKLLHECMRSQKIFDKRMQAMIKVGEEVNKLDAVLLRLKDQYNQEIDYQIGILNTVLEPIMIIFIGLFVGFILVAMYLPMFQLGSGLGQ